jgi:hypothetical protein
MVRCANLWLGRRSKWTCRRGTMDSIVDWYSVRPLK